MIKKLITILIFITIGFSIKIFAQDTIRYVGKLDDFLIYESIELYSDSTFKWTSEYDLSWSEFGEYTLTDKNLILNFNEEWGDKVKIYLIEESKMYLLDNKGNKIRKIKDKSLKKKWSLFRNGRHKFYFVKQD